jgi:ABC-type glycerol-3-phosphate transport system substrate-binding protein
VSTPQATPDGPRTLRIWVPPQFDPAAETPADALLQERLDEFVARRPNLQFEVRVKAESMLNALVTTQAAAPTITPDLVALSRPDLEAATANGLLHPLDGLSTLPDDPDWYPFARQITHIQNTSYGLPFAGDALILAGYEDPLPTNWKELAEETTFIFPAADPDATFSLSLYLSAGGALVDEEGLPKIDEAILNDVFSLYLPSEEVDFLSPAVTDYQSDEQAWNALLEQRGTFAVTWISNYLQNQTTALNIAPLPGLESGQYTLATGWSWALAGSNLENQPLAVELAEFLSDSQFLAEWTQAAGYLPTRPTALTSWKGELFKMEIAQTAEAANLVPSQELRNVIGPLLEEATISVINGEQLPAEAVQFVTEQLK